MKASFCCMLIFVSSVSFAQKYAPVEKLSANEVWAIVKYAINEKNLSVEYFSQNNGTLKSTYHQYLDGLLTKRAKFLFNFTAGVLGIDLIDIQYYDSQLGSWVQSGFSILGTENRQKGKIANRIREINDDATTKGLAIAEFGKTPDPTSTTTVVTTTGAQQTQPQSTTQANSQAGNAAVQNSTTSTAVASASASSQVTVNAITTYRNPEISKTREVSDDEIALLTTWAFYRGTFECPAWIQLVWSDMCYKYRHDKSLSNDSLAARIRILQNQLPYYYYVKVLNKGTDNAYPGILFVEAEYDFLYPVLDTATMTISFKWVSRDYYKSSTGVEPLTKVKLMIKKTVDAFGVFDYEVFDYEKTVKEHISTLPKSDFDERKYACDQNALFIAPCRCLEKRNFYRYTGTHP